RAAAVVLLAAAPLVAPIAATAVPDSPEVVGQACADAEEGVTVVVDASDLGGQVTIGCATGEVGSGTEALRAAGFTDERDEAQMICAIDSVPDPCPTTWEGVWWSYWTAESDGGWEVYEVGSDDSEPRAGTLEGWRYHDGSAGPVLTPAQVLATAGQAQDDGEDPAQDGAGGEEPPADVDDAGWLVPVTIAAVALLLGGLAVLAVRRRRAADARRDTVDPSEP
ncbi:hypothetical protein N869_10920, partial [Cellulomonas bogoriensis 69B4 = DSM 16987]